MKTLCVPAKRHGNGWELTRVQDRRMRRNKGKGLTKRSKITAIVSRSCGVSPCPRPHLSVLVTALFGLNFQSDFMSMTKSHVASRRCPYDSKACTILCKFGPFETNNIIQSLYSFWDHAGHTTVHLVYQSGHSVCGITSGQNLAS